MSNGFRERRRLIGRKAVAAVSSVPGKESRMYGEADPNFLEETKDEIEESGHTTDDIEFIGNRNRTISLGGWKGFAKAIDRTYNDDFGNAEVAGDLAIFFKDHSVMFRYEYDGAEWWQYIASSESHRKPPVAVLDPERVWVGTLFSSLEDWYEDSLKQKSKEAIKKKMSKI